MTSRNKPSASGTALRQRAAVSCDFCKRKRARCIRLDPHGPCSNCVADSVECESKHVRKQRVYGSVESLSLRFRALDALVAGLFPQYDTKSLDGLYALAAERGIILPDRGDTSHAHELFASRASSNAQQQGGSASCHTQTPDLSSASINLRDEKLVPTASGVGHYVGPSSSFRFVSTIRQMLRESAQHSTLDANSILKHEFSTLRSSLALEQNIAADSHPVGSFSDTAGTRAGWAPADMLAKYPALPAREHSDAFVRNFFEQLHPHYPLFLRPVFQLQYEALWETGPALVGATDLGWSCCLAMIVIFGMQIAPQVSEPLEDARRRLLAFVRSSLGNVVAAASVAHVQALLLLQLYEHNSGQRNAAWILLGCASRMAIALGMHLEGANRSCRDAHERSTRARVWWTLFSFERTLSIMLGRPSAIDDAETTVAMPDAANTSDDADMPLRYIEFSVRLSKMQSAVRQWDFCPPESDTAPPVDSAQRILCELQIWRDELPRHLRPEWRSMIPQHRRATLLLQIYHEHMIILVTRPFLIYHIRQHLIPHARPIDPSDPLRSMRETCLCAAEKMLCLCQIMLEENLIDTRNWIDVYFIYLGIFVLGLELLSPANRDGTGDADRHRRKHMIQATFESLSSWQLAPTYHILIKVAHQFGLISGAVEDDQPVVQPLPQLTSPNPVPQAIVSAEPLTIENVLDQLPMEGTGSLAWDSFDMGAYSTLGGSVFDPHMPDNQVILSWQELFSNLGALAERGREWH